MSETEEIVGYIREIKITHIDSNGEIGFFETRRFGGVLPLKGKKDSEAVRTLVLKAPPKGRALIEVPIADREDQFEEYDVELAAWLLASDDEREEMFEPSQPDTYGFLYTPEAT